MIGECGIKPSEFWKMTRGETTAIVIGHQMKQSYESANFRNLYYTMVRLWSKEKKSAQQLWPLPIDSNSSEMTKEQIYARNKKAIEYFNAIRRN